MMVMLILKMMMTEIFMRKFTVTKPRCSSGPVTCMSDSSLISWMVFGPGTSVLMLGPLGSFGIAATKLGEEAKGEAD